jgi:hypothetical protein
MGKPPQNPLAADDDKLRLVRGGSRRRSEGCLMLRLIHRLFTDVLKAE